MIVFGTHKYGWVDEVPGLGCVATSFIHVMYIPLIPTGSYLIFEEDEDMGISISLSMKSVLVAYVRAFLFWTFFISMLSSVGTFGISCIIAAPFGVAWFAMPWLVRPASEARAEELRQLL